MLKLSKKIIAPFLSYSIFLRGCLFMPHPVYRPETTRARLPASRFACFLSQAQSRCWHCNLLPVLSITNCEPNQLHITWFLPVRPVPSCGVCLSVSPSLSNSRAEGYLSVVHNMLVLHKFCDMHKSTMTYTHSYIPQQKNCY